MSGFLDPTHLINTFGLIGIMVIIFAETGLLVGFFLPGDSPAVHRRPARGRSPVAPLWVVLLLPLAAVLGNLVGYWIGHRAGPAVFNRPNSRLFKAEYVERSAAFFGRNGARAILLARFVPIVRTFAVTAGASRMDFRRYALYPVIGGIAWAAG
ncbi:membrane-associated protein [Modestobacter sp. DSM 44400]|uniref:DedA family protein n=1 Tax=Modestobacter sp. DSM 44400 TaxID=1550230 RepID=UPI00089874CD|nr:VTT domain-containing protein [Modestobacter sp. DSM 44400]SDY25875.1 membrane-associated protein [Modestobacter sp. DSM 44400]